MAHPAQAWINAHRVSRHQPGAVDADVRGRQRMDRIKQPTKVDASTWSPPASREISPSPVNLSGPLKLDKREAATPPKYARGGGIHIKSENKGLLHKNLGVPAGEKIPVSRMEKAKSGASPAEKKRIVFAENARKWNKG